MILKKLTQRFYAHWCHRCAAMEPEWIKAANIAPPGVSYGNVECESQKHLRKRMGVKAYPTIIVFENGHPIQEYTGERTAASFDAYVRKMVEKPFVTDFSIIEVLDVLTKPQKEPEFGLDAQFNNFYLFTHPSVVSKDFIVEKAMKSEPKPESALNIQPAEIFSILSQHQRHTLSRYFIVDTTPLLHMPSNKQTENSNANQKEKESAPSRTQKSSQSSENYSSLEDVKDTLRLILSERGRQCSLDGVQLPQPSQSIDKYLEWMSDESKFLLLAAGVNGHFVSVFPFTSESEASSVQIPQCYSGRKVAKESETTTSSDSEEEKVDFSSSSSSSSSSSFISPFIEKNGMRAHTRNLTATSVPQQPLPRCSANSPSTAAQRLTLKSGPPPPFRPDVVLLLGTDKYESSASEPVLTVKKSTQTLAKLISLFVFRNLNPPSAEYTSALGDWMEEANALSVILAIPSEPLSADAERVRVATDGALLAQRKQSFMRLSWDLMCPRVEGSANAMKHDSSSASSSVSSSLPLPKLSLSDTNTSLANPLIPPDVSGKLYFSILNTTKYVRFDKWFGLKQDEIASPSSPSEHAVVFVYNATSEDTWTLPDSLAVNNSPLDFPELKEKGNKKEGEGAAATGSGAKTHSLRPLNASSLTQWLVGIGRSAIAPSGSMAEPLSKADHFTNWITDHQTGIIIGVVLFIVLFFVIVIVIVVKSEPLDENDPAVQNLIRQLGGGGEEDSSESEKEDPEKGTVKEEEEVQSSQLLQEKEENKDIRRRIPPQAEENKNKQALASKTKDPLKTPDISHEKNSKNKSNKKK
ncbi:Protein disulfide-isomerase [Monocercomonoides exilis]|uniref:Protein disulfide-isomerase n=1 Tax=Monocercomonoides exilis TaxID=2049356 RepID=UPI00355A18A1|nr:Protein disulfide-isomerase [Monocercomonoides exilis]|eukprot:MONOS_13359.1-p1 / transcript=MONOS_13359.1 / gene=MONOS_13359 / organism=Monocercomonoides_exilis_PA203 / gene_product=Protein disulfide-isomerase / transcript_product=Protein disulfide-isomerase / location=Mono_scaffold00816:13009-15541(+) / protein_length=809 / sequence_SO=supercontig / SO=protein_coding / is_pseudo=false